MAAAAISEPQPGDAALIERAQRLADNELFPRALEIDRGHEVPVRELDLLADAGLYGASVAASPATITTLLEVLSSGCLTTAFVWAQHLGSSAAAHATTGPANRFAPGLLSGELRGGVAFAHMLRPDPPLTTATPEGDGWRFHGDAPWVTGWGHIDLVHAAARHGDDIVWALLDAEESATLRSTTLDLATMMATRTVELHYEGHPVPADRVTRVIERRRWLADYRLGLRNNGSFPLGVALRCCRLLEDPAMERRLVELREALDAASPDDMTEARAETALFAARASTMLVAKIGGRGVTLDHHAQRLHREAMFLLVQGQTPHIKAHMLQRLGEA
ncbi:MAG: acyl-CoA dehydrogenase family protein [Actinomycetota bacterium]